LINQYYQDMDHAYPGVFQRVSNNGQPFIHRGAKCVELRPYSMELADPMHALFTGKTRRMNYRFWAAETLAYIAGWGTRYMHDGLTRLLIALNSNYVKFCHDTLVDRRLNKMVCYGDGFGAGLPRSWRTLDENTGRRQAYVSIWDTDTQQSYEGSPCLTGAQFFSDHAGRLCSLFSIRSNDLNWGFPYDVASFCAIQIAMAGALGMPVGSYHHVACSMHYYENGNMGEGPPNISRYEEEERLASPPEMPPPPERQEFTKLQTRADYMLRVMLSDIENCRPLWKYAPELCDDAWSNGWAKVVRWSWPRR
jgi:hypothetical protein